MTSLNDVEYYAKRMVFTAVPHTKDDKEGYLVKYPNGYEEWKHKTTFELSYVPLGKIGHLNEYLIDFVSTKALLDRSIDVLEHFIDNDKGFKRMADDNITRKTLMRQLSAMQDYSKMLTRRSDVIIDKLRG